MLLIGKNSTIMAIISSISAPIIKIMVLLFNNDVGPLYKVHFYYE